MVAGAGCALVPGAPSRACGSGWLRGGWGRSVTALLIALWVMAAGGGVARAADADPGLQPAHPEQAITTTLTPPDNTLILNGAAPPGGQESPSFPLSDHMDVLEDPDGNLIIDDVIGTAAVRFHPVAGSVNRGYTTEHTWVRIKLRQIAATDHEEGQRWFLQLAPAFLDHVDVYTVAPGRMRHMVYGTREETAQRPYKGREPLIPLVFDSGETLTVYIHIHTTSISALLGTVTADWPAIHALSRQSLWVGIYLGIAMAMLMANLIYGLWLKDKNNLAYAVHVLTLIGMTIGNHNMLVELLPAWAADITSIVRLGSIILGLATGMILANVILNIRHNFPRIYRLVWPLALTPILMGLILSLIGHAQSIIYFYNVIAIIVIGVVLYCGIVLSHQGNRVAQLAVVSFIPSISVTLISTLGRLGLLPLRTGTDEYFLLAGALHLILMNLAIAYRVRQLEIDRRVALAAALDASQNAGKQARELVSLRTRELAASNSQLSQALAAERQAIKEQIQFIDMVSHEYRAPVVALREAIDVLVIHRDSVLRGLPQDLLTRMGKAVERLVEIIEVGLRLEGPQSTALSILSTSMDLPTVARTAVQSVLSTFPNRTVAMDGPDHLMMLGDPDLLKTALLNLLGDALKYSPPTASVHLDIILKSPQPDGVVQVRVSDQGPGVPLPDQERVFQKFVRLSQTQRIPGTGLGLFMVRRIAELHDGRAYVDPSYVGGCRVVIEMPCRSPETAPADSSTLPLRHPA